MAKAAPKRKTGTKKTARKAAPAEVAVKKSTAKAAAKKAAPKKAAAPAKRGPGRPPGKKAAAAKRPVGRPPGKKAAVVAPAKRGRPPGRKAAVAKTVVRRGRPPAVARRLASAVGVQSFGVSHLDENDFKTDGLRPYALYRDLGIAVASAGLCRAHVIRLVPPCTDEVRKRHQHDTELQLIYVLKGWIKNEFEGYGVQMMSAGSCWLQPPGIAHTVLDYSADCEMLEIIVPADFDTVDLA